MSGPWETQASVSPASVVAGDSAQPLVRVRIADPGDPGPAAAALTGVASTQARRIASEILAAADDADRRTEQNGCEETAR